jgi:hypothetical protein
MIIWFTFATTFAKASVVKESYGVHGRLTEWLGSGLQNRLRRFESATDLKAQIEKPVYQQDRQVLFFQVRNRVRLLKI